MRKRHRKKRNIKTNTRDEVPCKRRRNDHCKSAGEGPTKDKSVAPKRPRDKKGESRITKRNRAEELENGRKSQPYYSAEEGPSPTFKTAKGNLISRPDDPSDQRGSKRPGAEISESIRKSKRPMADSVMERGVSRGDTGGRSHKRRKPGDHISEDRSVDVEGTDKSRLEKGNSVPQAVAGVSGTPSVSTSVTHSFSLESFTFHQKIGKGSFGKVMLASHHVSGQQLAIKMVRKRTLVNHKKRVLIEKQVLEIAGGSSFISHAYATFQTEDYVFYAMEYLSGGDLFHFIRSRAPCDIPTTRFIAAEIVCGLQFLHSKGVIHRDLKPGNILLDSTGHVKIADFGLAVTDMFGDKKTSGCTGTPRYMAPEVFLCERYGAAVDWFALGIILFHLSTGRYPFFRGKDEEKIVYSLINDKPCYPRTINPVIKDALEKLLYKSPVERLVYGGQRIREHPLFASVDWVELEAGKIHPPFTMEPKPALDMSQIISVNDLLSSAEVKKPPITSEDKRLFCGLSFVSDRWRVIQQPNKMKVAASELSITINASIKSGEIPWRRRRKRLEETWESQSRENTSSLIPTNLRPHNNPSLLFRISRPVLHRVPRLQCIGRPGIGIFYLL